VQRAEATLLVEGVDLYDDPVDLVTEVGAPRLPRDAGLRDLLDRLEPLDVGIRPEPALPQPRERLRLGRELVPVEDPDPVDEDRQRPLRRDRGVQLPE
jgi:hypothetical protein